ncbi:MAG: hypothetical protein HY776_00885 [Actinobacteria bacterium]|nr:hypothetical protein [Actinomycetota bacterium]
MNDLTTGIISVIIGFILLVFRKPLALIDVKLQNKTWGFHFGEKEIRMSEGGNIIVGIAFITIGILFIFGIVHIG